jgi:phage shock protein PspC (stress-responsive transcriptional regulator)
MNFWQKVTSRKFLAALVGMIMGVAMVFGLDRNTINTVAGALTAVLSVVSYIAAEGKIDAASVAKAAQAVEDARQVLCDDTAADIAQPTAGDVTATVLTTEGVANGSKV